MIRSYIIIALRNFRKHKFLASINIIGLSLSMSVCLVIILLIHDHFQYDKFHPKGDRIYRATTYTVGSEGPFDEAYASSPLLIKEQLIDKYSFIESGTNLNSSFRGEIRSPLKILEVKSLFADQDFFDVFGFEVLEGSNTDGLADPFSLFLSELMAEKLFPNQSPIGQTVDFADHGNYKIIGVVKSPPGKTHLKFEVLASMSTLPVLVKKGIFDDRYKKWENVWSNYNYLVLKDASSRDKAEQVINEIVGANMKLDDEHPGYVIRLQSINEIVPGTIMSNEISFALPWFVLAFFALLGFILIITATINYTNLSIAKSLTRTKEIGIRKVNGANRNQIVTQFLIESVIIAIISLIVALVMYKVLIQSFNEIWIFSQLGIELKDSWNIYIYFFGFTLLLGIITGIGPSLFLSKMDTIKSLKGSLVGLRLRKKSILSFLTGKRSLLSIQFSLSIIILVSILVLKDQANFLVNTNFGFDDDKVFFIETQGHDPVLIVEQFSSIPGVEEVSLTSHHPAVGTVHGKGAQWKIDQEPIPLYYFSVDPSYVDVMGLNLIAGSNFPKNAGVKNEKFLLLNERAIEVFGFESNAEAIGEVITIDSMRLTINGVIKDYHWEPLMKSIRPLALRITTENYNYVYFRLGNINSHDFKKAFEDKWISFDSAREFKGGFLNSKLDEFYQFFFDMGSILKYIALLAVVITSLGFFGMVSFELKTKVKEIGIRKVLGAGFKDLTFTLSKKFMVMIILTAFFSIPLSIFINSLWVNEMASHSPLGIMNAIPALLIIGIICAATILSQVWVNSRQNPSETLRAN